MWVGWVRVLPSGRWCAACRAVTWGEAWGLLLRIDPPGQYLEKIVMEAGRRP